MVRRAAACHWPSTAEPIDLLLDPREPDALAELEVGLGGVHDGHAGGRRHLDQIEGAVDDFEGRDARSELLRDTLLDEPRASLAHGRARRGREHAVQLAHSSLTGEP